MSASLQICFGSFGDKTPMEDCRSGKTSLCLWHVLWDFLRGCDAKSDSKRTNFPAQPQLHEVFRLSGVRVDNLVTMVFTYKKLRESRRYVPPLVALPRIDFHSANQSLDISHFSLHSSLCVDSKEKNPEYKPPLQLCLLFRLCPLTLFQKDLKGISDAFVYKPPRSKDKTLRGQVWSDQLISSSLIYSTEQLSHQRDHTQGSLSPQRLPASFWWGGGRRGEANEKGCLFAFWNGVW